MNKRQAKKARKKEKEWYEKHGFCINDNEFLHVLYNSITEENGYQFGQKLYDMANKEYTIIIQPRGAGRKKWEEEHKKEVM